MVDPGLTFCWVSLSWSYQIILLDVTVTIDSVASVPRFEKLHKRESHLIRLGSLFPIADGRLDLSMSPIPPTPLCFPLWHLTLSWWHYCVAAFSSRIILLLSPFPQWQSLASCTGQDWANSSQLKAFLASMLCRLWEKLQMSPSQADGKRWGREAGREMTTLESSRCFSEWRWGLRVSVAPAPSLWVGSD